MKNLTLEMRTSLPEDMRGLIRAYPRDAWPDHPDFAQSIAHWMGAHQMFRKLAEITLRDTEKFLDRKHSEEDYTGRLGYYGNLLLRNLHGHHHWEDRSFFPELVSADQAFERGQDLLEADHVELDQLLNDMSTRGNRVLKLMQLEPEQVTEEAKSLRDLFERSGRFLERHLNDEEDLVVPFLLHHKLRG